MHVRPDFQPTVTPSYCQDAGMKHWCCIIDSDLLGEKIVLVAREPHVERARMLYPESVVYTCDEISRLDGACSDTVREIHDVKKAFNGSLLQLQE